MTAGLLVRIFTRYALVIILAGAIGALAGTILARPATDASVASVPMALQDVAWSDLTATHRANEEWVESSLAPSLEVGSIDITYRPPVDLQFTAFSIEVRADTDPLALDTARRASVLLLQEQQTRFADDLRQDRRPLEARITTADEELAALTAALGDTRSQQGALIDAGGNQALIDELAGEAWAIETRRNSWEQERIAAVTALSALEGSQAAERSPVSRIGDPRLERSSSDHQRLTSTLAGAFVGMWIGVLGAYLWEMHHGRARYADHPTLQRLGIQITELGKRDIDRATFLAVAASIADHDAVVSLVDTSANAGAVDLAWMLTGAGIDDKTVGFVPADSNDRVLIGTSAILVASSRTRVSQVERAFQRCRTLDVPVLRVVLMPPTPLRTRDDRPQSTAILTR